MTGIIENRKLQNDVIIFKPENGERYNISEDADGVTAVRITIILVFAGSYTNRGCNNLAGPVYTILALMTACRKYITPYLKMHHSHLPVRGPGSAPEVVIPL